jgi:hypothetical protein
MREARRRREIKDYYLAISADEITSYLTPASFDLWASLARYRQEFQFGARWLSSAAAWATWPPPRSSAATTCS